MSGSDDRGMPAWERTDAKSVYGVAMCRTDAACTVGRELTSSCSYDVSGDAAFASLLKRTVFRTVFVAAAGACDVTAASRPCFETRYT